MMDARMAALVPGRTGRTVLLAAVAALPLLATFAPAQAQAQGDAATAAEGAAGSRFILVPVELQAAQKDGAARRYRGYFVLRAVVADGASAEQRRWRLHSAEIERLPDQSSKR